MNLLRIAAEVIGIQTQSKANLISAAARKRGNFSISNHGKETHNLFFSQMRRLKPPSHLNERLKFLLKNLLPLLSFSEGRGETAEPGEILLEFFPLDHLRLLRRVGLVPLLRIGLGVGSHGESGSRFRCASSRCVHGSNSSSTWSRRRAASQLSGPPAQHIGALCLDGKCWGGNQKFVGGGTGREGVAFLFRFHGKANANGDGRGRLTGGSWTSRALPSFQQGNNRTIKIVRQPSVRGSHCISSESVGLTLKDNVAREHKNNPRTPLGE